MADVPVDAVLAAARALMMVGQWERADDLLTATATGDAAEQALLALARAEVAVQIRQFRGTGDPADALGLAAAQIAGHGPSHAAFDLDLLRLFIDYWTVLTSTDHGGPESGPEGRDPAVLAELTRRAERLTTAAPDQRRRARAFFCDGLIADNLRGEHARGEALFFQSLAACEPGDDDDYASEALRHLGGVAQDNGDLALARERWERSTELAQRAGWLTLALAQQVLLAELSAEEGDTAGAVALATEVRRWAHALGMPRHEAQAAAIASAV